MQIRSGSKLFIYLLCASFFLIAYGFPEMVRGAADEKKDKDKGRYTLSVQITPPAGGSVTPSNGTYAQGQTVQLTATANANYAFDFWTGGASGSSNPVVITMNRNKTVVAHFKKCKQKNCKKNPDDCED